MHLWLRCSDRKKTTCNSYNVSLFKNQLKILMEQIVMLEIPINTLIEMKKRITHIKSMRMRSSMCLNKHSTVI